jgi:hypothetical protein
MGFSGRLVTTLMAPPQGVEAVKDRGGAFGHFDLGDIKGGEASQIGIAVIHDVNGNTVHEQRHAFDVESAHLDGPFVAGAGAGNRHPGHQIQGLGQIVPVEFSHGLFIDPIHAAHLGFPLGGNDDFAQPKNAGCFGVVRRRLFRVDRHGHGNKHH